MKQVLRLILSCVLGMCMVGCVASTHAVRLDSISTINPMERTYVIVPEEEAQGRELEYREMAMVLAEALRTGGFRITDNRKDADAILRFSFGTEDPEQHTEYSTSPVYGVVGHKVEEKREYDARTGRYRTERKSKPEYGVVGTQTNAYVVTTYLSKFFLSATDTTRAQEPLWQTKIFVTDNEGNMRKLAPIVFASTRNMIGSSTSGVVELSIELMDDGTYSIEQE